MTRASDAHGPTVTLDSALVEVAGDHARSQHQVPVPRDRARDPVDVGGVPVGHLAERQPVEAPEAEDGLASLVQGVRPYVATDVRARHRTGGPAGAKVPAPGAAAPVRGRDAPQAGPPRADRRVPTMEHGRRVEAGRHGSGRWWWWWTRRGRPTVRFPASSAPRLGGGVVSGPADGIAQDVVGRVDAGHASGEPGPLTAVGPGPVGGGLPRGLPPASLDVLARGVRANVEDPVRVAAERGIRHAPRLPRRLWSPERSTATRRTRPRVRAA